MRLSIVIANFNTCRFLEACLASIERTLPLDWRYEVIVVDNASTDGSVAMLRANYPSVRLVELGANVGFSAANNRAVAVSQGRYVLFLNPDTLVHDGTIDTMMRFMDDRENAGAATCAVWLPSGELDEGSHRGFPTPWNALWYFSGVSRRFPYSRLVSGYTLGWMDLRSVHEIDALVGAFMLVRRDAGEQVGWWDEDFFFYGEDLDFCYRLRAAGWAIYYVPGASILHYKGASAGIKEGSKKLTTATPETRERATRARFDAMRIFYRKHYVGKYPRALTWLVLRAIDWKESRALRGV